MAKSRAGVLEEHLNKMLVIFGGKLECYATEDDRNARLKAELSLWRVAEKLKALRVADGRAIIVQGNRKY